MQYSLGANKAGFVIRPESGGLTSGSVWTDLYQPFMDSEHEVLAPVNIFLRPKSGVHPWISPVDLKFLDAIVQAGSGVDGLSSVRGFHQLCLRLTVGTSAVQFFNDWQIIISR
ncbi:hypothetical protein Tco_1202163 [Tanacetum coccineum]